jgi:hypothetical protein
MSLLCSRWRKSSPYWLRPTISQSARNAAAEKSSEPCWQKYQMLSLKTLINCKCRVWVCTHQWQGIRNDSMLRVPHHGFSHGCDQRRGTGVEQVKIFHDRTDNTLADRSSKAPFPPRAAAASSQPPCSATAGRAPLRRCWAPGAGAAPNHLFLPQWQFYREQLNRLPVSMRIGHIDTMTSKRAIHGVNYGGTVCTRLFLAPGHWGQS